MNPGQIAYFVSIGWLSSRILTVLLETAGNSFYDVRQTKIQRQRRHSRKGSKKQLSISIIIYAYDAEKTIEACLQSLINSKHPKLEILVIDNGSRDNTRTAIRNFIRSHPKVKIRLMSKRTRLKETDIKLPAGAFKKDLVMNLDGSSAVDSLALKNISDHFSRTNINVLIASAHVITHKSLLGLLQQYDALRAASASKLVPGGPFAVTRNKPLKNVQKAYYADDVRLTREPFSSYGELLRQATQEHLYNLKIPQRGFIRSCFRVFRGTVLMLEPILVGYFVYLALALERPEPLAIAWALSIFSLLFYVWSDSYTPLRQKLRLVALAPSMYLLTYILSLTRLAAIIFYISDKARADWESWTPGPLSSGAKI